MDTSLCHHDCALVVSFLCYMLSILCTMTYPVALVEIDVMISPLRIRFVFFFFLKVSHTVPSVLRYLDAAVVTLVVVEVV